jgi:hypothetical protein
MILDDENRRLALLLPLLPAYQNHQVVAQKAR